MNIINILAGNNFFIFNKDIAKSYGTDVAIILGAFCNRYDYYQKRNELMIIDNKEYFYCIREDIYNDTGLNEHFQRQAIKKLQELKILEIIRKGVPSKNYYYINVDALLCTLRTTSSSPGEPVDVHQVNLNNNNIIINNNIKKNNNINNKNIYSEEVKTIINYLNEKAKKNFRETSKGTVNIIIAKLKEGYSVEDFKNVIDKKVNKWLNDEKMNEYLRPSTLFGNKFESYLNERAYFTNNTVKSSYSSVDNTANHVAGNPKISDLDFRFMTFEARKDYISHMDLADMTKDQREFFDKYCLARDENGDLLKF